MSPSLLIIRARPTIMSDRHEHGPGEKRFIAKAYAFFAKLKKQPCFKGRRTREIVAECLGCSPATAQRYYNESVLNAGEFSEVTTRFIMWSISN